MHYEKQFVWTCISFINSNSLNLCANLWNTNHEKILMSLQASMQGQRGPLWCWGDMLRHQLVSGITNADSSPCPRREEDSLARHCTTGGTAEQRCTSQWLDGLQKPVTICYVWLLTAAPHWGCHEVVAQVTRELWASPKQNFFQRWQQSF